MSYFVPEIDSEEDVELGIFLNVTKHSTTSPAKKTADFSRTRRACISIIAPSIDFTRNSIKK